MRIERTLPCPPEPVANLHQSPFDGAVAQNQPVCPSTEPVLSAIHPCENLRDDNGESKGSEPALSLTKGRYGGALRNHVTFPFC